MAPQTTRSPAAMPAITIDQREKQPYTFTSIPADKCNGGGVMCIETRTAHLLTGDYALSGFEHLVAVEKKSMADLYHTLGQGRDRFVRELERLSRYEVAAVVVEAEWSDVLAGPPRHSQLRPKTVFRSVLAWQQRFPRVHWWFVPGRAVAEVVTFRVLERWWKDRAAGRAAAGGDSCSTTTPLPPPTPPGRAEP